jgi:hypothetical protein
VRNVEWQEVRTLSVNELNKSLKALETCPLEDVEIHRGKVVAYRKVLGLQEEIENIITDGQVPSFI